MSGTRPIDTDTVLRVNVWTLQAGEVVTVSGRMIDDDGCPSPFLSTVVAANATRGVTSRDIPLGKGTLLSIQIVAGAAAARGLTFASAQLAQGFGGNTFAYDTLLAGYVTTAEPIAWPGSAVRSSADGRGAARAVLTAAPAAGAELLVTVPANARWSLVAVAASLLTSAAVANRVPVLTIDDGANVIYEIASAVAVAASQAASYRAAAGVPFLTLGTRDYTLPLPVGLLLPAGARIRSVTGAIDVGDQYGATLVAVEEWIDA